MPFATSTPAKKHGTSDDSRVSIELDETAEHENMLNAEGGDNCTQTTSITLDDGEVLARVYAYTLSILMFMNRLSQKIISFVDFIACIF